MLTRILTDNPAHAFTQNFDAKFVSTVKELLREGKDTSVQQILRETLDYFEFEKAPSNPSLGPLTEMWKKEKGKRNALHPSVCGNLSVGSRRKILINHSVALLPPAASSAVTARSPDDAIHFHHLRS